MGSKIGRKKNQFLSSIFFRFVHEIEQKVDANTASMEPNFASNRWLSIRLEMLGNLIIFFASLLCVLGRGTLDPGIVGLSLSYAMQVL